MSTKIKTDIASLENILSRLEAKAAREGLNETERNLRREVMDTINDLKMQLPEPVLSQGGSTFGATSTGAFYSFGDQLAAVAHAGIPGGQTDPRLYNAAAGLGEAVSSDGGFMVQNDFASDMYSSLFAQENIASRCRRIPISGNSNSIKINAYDETSRVSTRFGGVLGYWLAEADQITASKPKFRQMELTLKKLCGVCYASDELLGDTQALGQIIADAFAGEMNFRVTDAIINGTGAGQPLGILNSGALVTVAKETGQAANTIMAENVIKMYSALMPSASPNIVWLVNRTVLPQLYTMSLAVGTGGVPVFMPANGVSGLPYNSLFGYPVLVVEQCAALGTVGDIILADLGSYILAEKGGIKTDMSIHVRFLYDEACFRFVLRIDGQPALAAPLTPFKGGQTFSPLVALATRS